MNKVKRFMISSLLLVHGSSFADNASEGETEQQNVVMINIDNLDKGSLSYFGNDFIETPNIDKLFENGLRMQNFHTAARCCASRSALLTGRYHARNGPLGTGAAWGQTVDGVTTIAHVFKNAGYNTGMFGKWHLGDSHGLRPEDRGFDEVCSFENGECLSSVLIKPGYNGSPRTGEAFRFNHNGTYQVYNGFRTDIFFREAMDFIENRRNKNKPFFIYLATITAHAPCFGPEDLQAYYKKKYEKDQYKPLRDRFENDLKKQNIKPGKLVSYPYDHAADIANIDRNIGRLMAKLKELNLLKNTIVLFMSDGSGRGAASADRDKIKFNTHSQNPTVFLLPGKKEGKDIDGPVVANIDILPTLADICKIKLSDALKHSIDGQSFAASLGVENAQPWKKRFYIYDHQSSGNRDGINQQMVIKPLNVTTVTCPDGKSVSWKSGKVSGNVGNPERIALAKKAYDKWLKRVLEDFPLGAYVKTHINERPVFLRAYPIVDGPGGKGLQLYFLLDVAEDGTYELDTNVSDYFGAKRTQKKVPAGKITAFRKVVDGHLPVGFDNKLHVYKVLPDVLAKSFKKAAEANCNGKVDLSLRKGRYIINFKDANSQASEEEKIRHPPKMKIRVQKK